MANKTITMSKIRQILRLYTQGKSKLFISTQTGVARNTVKKYLRQFHEQRLTFEQIHELNDEQLEQLFGKEPLPVPSDCYEKLQAFFPRLDKEIKRAGVTIDLLWKEYLKEHPDGYRHSQFGYYCYCSGCMIISATKARRHEVMPEADPSFGGFH